MDFDITAQLEECAVRAWPPALIEDVEGWEVRCGPGHSNRMNSVRPRRHDSDQSIDSKLASAEAFYRKRDLPVLYQISPLSQPADLDSILDHRGYARYDHSQFQTAPLRTVVALASSRIGAPTTRWSHIASGAWCDRWVEFSEMAESNSTQLLEVLRRVAVPSLYVELQVNNSVVAVGRGVCDGRWLGVFNMATRAPDRRKGAGMAILKVIARWGMIQRADTTYLQVDTDNYAALRLYADCGFTTHHAYWYRIRR